MTNSGRITFLVLFLSACHGLAGVREELPLNEGWRFARANVPGAASADHDDHEWESVTLPHTWNARDGQDGGNDYYRGIGWYRTRVTIDSRHAGKSVFLRFEGVSTAAQVYVNGAPVGSHRGAFGAFCFDVTSSVQIGESNSIAVRVSNARDSTIAPLRGDFTMFGGIYRGVRLLILDELSISPVDDASPGVYVKQTSVTREAAELDIASVVRNGSARGRNASIRTSILDAEGEVVQMVTSAVLIPPASQTTGHQHIALRSPRLWNGRKDPYLYRVRVELLEGNEVKDDVVESVGLRFFHVDPGKGFFLNGAPYRLYGVNRHQDREDKGWAISLADQEEDYRLIEEMGCTAVRLAHYQHARDFYGLCDRGGMVVWAELALVDEIHSCPEFAEVCRGQLTELIKQNFNHPSIMFWSIFNELMPESNPDLYAALVTSLNSLAKELDPTRLTTMASRSRYDASEFMNTVTDLTGYNIYRGWYEGQPEDFAGFVDTLHERFPDRRFAVGEYGAGAGLTQHEIPPRKPSTRGPWHPEEWQSRFHEVIWGLMAEREFLWGTFVWNMFDFASDGRSEGEFHGRNDKGLVSFDRRVKKDAFFWYKANWNPEPMTYIASKRFTPRPAGVTEVRVYSNCDSVSLSINGHVVGNGTSTGRVFVWAGVELALGENRVVATGFRDGRRITDSCIWKTPLETANRGRVGQ